jgi:hypothetical protein
MQPKHDVKPLHSKSSRIRNAWAFSTPHAPLETLPIAYSDLKWC